ncbi:MAG TPA: transcriptional regulator [Rhodobiaceae bacterium]|nr:transcriptional regulator [Rhodobiaceae bacterium]
MDEQSKVGDALIALRQISRATSTDSRMLARASGLSVSQLIALQEISSAGSISPSRIAERMALSRGTMTTLMRKLEDRALVERSSDTIDKRRHFFSLTIAGKQALEEAPVMLHEKFSNKFGELKSWEQTLIISALERVAFMLDADNIEAAPILDVGEIS